MIMHQRQKGRKSDEQKTGEDDIMDRGYVQASQAPSILPWMMASYQAGRKQHNQLHPACFSISSSGLRGSSRDVTLFALIGRDAHSHSPRSTFLRPAPSFHHHA